MFDYTKTEIVAGAFLMLGLAALGYLSISIGGVHILPRASYSVYARFSNLGDLKLRAPVKVAGVTVGKVQSIKLVDDLGEAELSIDRKVALPKDTIASISTAGLLGDSFVSLSLGGADSNLKDGSRITHTEPALNMADILGRFAFGSSGQPAAPGTSDGEAPKPARAAKPPTEERPQ